LKLDRSELTQARAEMLSAVKDLYDIALIIEAASKRDPGNEQDQRTSIAVIAIIQKQAVEKTTETHQYAGMFRCFFQNNPIPPGI
jgi:hypothetical protein